MHHSIRSKLRNTLEKRGLEVNRTSSVPFGVHWHDDIRAFSNGRNLETAIDAGANTGQTALAIAKYFPRCRVYSFEPVPSTFAVLVSNTASHPLVEPVRAALGAAPGMASMKTGPRDECNTLVVDAESSDAPLLEVPVDTVDDFCASRKIQHLGLLKIDTEGYELQVLKGAHSLLCENRIDYILAECEFAPRDGEPHGDFFEIHRHVAPFGFRVVSFYTGGVDETGWVWGDVLFRRAADAAPGRPATSPFGQKT